MGDKAQAIGGFIAALAIVAFVVFVGVLVTEVNYVNDRPFRYGPAKVIAWGAGAGATLSVAVGLVGLALIRGRSGT